MVACEVDPVTASIAAGYWAEAGLAEKISCRVGDAKQSVADLLAEGQAGSFDFAYIDADKGSYDTYYEACLKLVRVGGVIVIDNTLWGGRVADRADQEPATQAIRALNEKLFRDDRIDLIQTAMGDGTTFARRRA